MYILGYNLVLWVLWAATLLISAFAVWKGDVAVRYAALTHVSVEVVTFLINPQFGDIGGESALLAVDFASAVIFLLLAVRFANLWIGAAMLLQASQFALHAYYLVMELPHDRLHAWINNTSDILILLCILLGAILAIRRRRTLAREEAELEAKRQQRVSPAR
ncbi:MAG TPA: hypothetical protein VGI95_20000 [Caulobacteraceae bacterium]|jgi:ABC-type multidrug transport system fused ATPase/permease subunit